MKIENPAYFQDQRLMDAKPWDYEFMFAVAGVTLGIIAVLAILKLSVTALRKRKKKQKEEDGSIEFSEDISSHD